MADLVVFSPAKINLFLAITGRRTDGFHDLVSVVAPISFGDTLWISPRDEGSLTLTCDDPELRRDESNLVIRAARAFQSASGWNGGAHFELAKRTPAGAGLGGGSSNATATLLGLNQLAGKPLDDATLFKVAAQLGSDCALFLQPGPVVMRGRGEFITPLPTSAINRLSGRRLLVFKPAFGIKTPWAYQQMVAEAPHSYLPSPEAEARLETWLANPAATAEALVFNNMERAAFRKYLALPTLLTQLRERFGVVTGMSGSGSASFAFLSSDSPTPAIREAIRVAWGDSVFIAEAEIR